MTNEQTAVLLRQISQNLRLIALEMEDLISDGDRQLKKFWIGDGKEPGKFSLHDLMSSESDWEYKPEGQFTAIQLVTDYADKLEDNADDLTLDNATQQGV